MSGGYAQPGMHEVFGYLAKRVDAARAAVDEVARELEKQLEREQKALESVEYGDEFDAERAQVMEAVVAAMQAALERMHTAEEQLQAAHETLREPPDLD